MYADLNASEQVLSEGWRSIIYLNNAQSNVDTHTREEKKGLTELRKENLDLQRQKDTLERNILGLQKRIADLFGKGVANRDSVLEADAELVRAQESLALSAVSATKAMKKASQTLERLLQTGVPTSDEGRVLLMQQISELKFQTAALEAKVLPNHGDTIEQCRVLEVNPPLNAVVISAGYKQGARTGFMLVSGISNEIELRVISVRADLSLCEVVRGSVKDLRSGMNVSATR